MPANHERRSFEDFNIPTTPASKESVSEYQSHNLKPEFNLISSTNEAQATELILTAYSDYHLMLDLMFKTEESSEKLNPVWNNLARYFRSLDKLKTRYLASNDLVSFEKDFGRLRSNFYKTTNFSEEAINQIRKLKDRQEFIGIYFPDESSAFNVVSDLIHTTKSDIDNIPMYLKFNPSIKASDLHCASAESIQKKVAEFSNKQEMSINDLINTLDIEETQAFMTQTLLSLDPSYKVAVRPVFVLRDPDHNEQDNTIRIAPVQFRSLIENVVKNSARYFLYRKPSLHERMSLELTFTQEFDDYGNNCLSIQFYNNGLSPEESFEVANGYQPVDSDGSGSALANLKDLLGASSCRISPREKQEGAVIRLTVPFSNQIAIRR